MMGSNMKKKFALLLCLLMCAVPNLAAPQSVEDLVRQGDKYRDGDGVAKDYGQAMVFYRKAADQGDANAQLKVGGLYNAGLGVAKDPQEAIIWLRKAAGQRFVGAELPLAFIYQNGLAVPQDYRQAM